MHLTSLALRNVRPYQHLDLSLDAGTTLLYGPNASGKTSLLEAVFYLATTRSPRTSTDRDLVRWGTQGEAGAAPFARMQAEVQQDARRLRLEILIQLRGEEAAAGRDDPDNRAQATAQKIVRINRKTVRALDLVGHLRVVLFTPTDVVLVTGAPTERRRYLDITLSQIEPRYVRTLSRYNRLVQQRNSLLRAWRERRRPLRGVDDELAYWDRELSTAGGYLLAERLRAIADLNALVGPIFCDITGAAEPLAVRYRPGCETADATSANDLARCLADHLRHLRPDELQRGQTLVGPHRDDILFTVGAVNLGTYGSRGQQRSVALALRLAEARLMQQRSGDTPVLLLDDLLSELDATHRAHLLQSIGGPGQQTLVTSTDLGAFDRTFLDNAACLRVEGGRVYPA
jgi:DNA replication and repair protein RecF